MSTTQKGPNLLDQWFFVQKVVSDRRLSRCAVACAFHLVDYYNDRLGRAWPSYVAEWSEEDVAVFSLVADVIEPFLLDRTRLRSVSLALATFPDGDAPPPILIESMDPASRAFLSTSLEFENLVVLRARGEWYALRDAETLIVQLSTILSLIRQNLDE